MTNKAMRVDFAEALKVWAKIGCLSFGGPAGQIALMHQELVERRQWLSDKEFLSALNFCMLLPGPEAMQCATYAGWRLHGVKGGLAAGLLFMLPGSLLIFLLSIFYAGFGREPAVEAVFYGVKAAVLAIVIEAFLRMSRRALKSRFDVGIALVSFIALFCFRVPFPIIIGVAFSVGFWRSGTSNQEPEVSMPPLRALGSTLLTWTTIWLVPLIALFLILGSGHILTQIGVFFSKLAVVTFGGAYAVLSYMGQTVVEHKAWLTQAQMIDGLGLAETTPGPLILVTQFVGYLAAYNIFGTIWAGGAAALITLWMTFAPCFMFVFAGAPYMEAIGKRPRLAGALAAITAAVVGVIFNLSLWFGLHVVFGTVERASTGWFRPWMPNWATLDPVALILSAIAAAALLRFHLGVLKTLGLVATLALVWRYAG